MKFGDDFFKKVEKKVLPEINDKYIADTTEYETVDEYKKAMKQNLEKIESFAIIMGNEGKGISQAIRNRIDKKLLIPNFSKSDTAESLNVAIATAITCSEFLRRKKRLTVSRQLIVNNLNNLIP